MLDCIPGDLELHQALDDIDEHLKQNAAGIEETVKELQSDLDKLCAGQKLEKNGDCLQWLNSSNCSSVKLFTTPCNQLTDFLKALLHFLKTEKGLEEMIMQLLLDLSSECGVVFPLTSCGASFHIPSTTSIHTVEDNGFLNALSMWDDVRLYLRRFIIDKLQNCQEINDVLPTIQLKTQCLQQLLFLYPETEVLTRYQNMQYQSVQDLLQNKVLINISEISFDEMTHGFEVMIPLVLTMMRQDLYALRTLAEDSKVQKFINDTYLQNIASELYILIEKFCEQQLKKNAMHSTKQLSTKANKYLNKQKRTVHSVGQCFLLLFILIESFDRFRGYADFCSISCFFLICTFSMGSCITFTWLQDKPILEPEDASCWQFSVVLRVWCSDGDIIFWVR